MLVLVLYLYCIQHYSHGVSSSFGLFRSPVHDHSISFNISMMFYRSFSLDFGIESNLNICPERPVHPSSFLDVGAKIVYSFIVLQACGCVKLYTR